MWVYRNIGDHKKELELAKDLYAFANSGYFKDPKRIERYRQMAYNNISDAYLELRRLDSALYYRQLVYQYARQSGELEFLIIAASRLSESYVKMEMSIQLSFMAGFVC